MRWWYSSSTLVDIALVACKICMYIKPINTRGHVHFKKKNSAYKQITVLTFKLNLVIPLLVALVPMKISNILTANDLQPEWHCFKTFLVNSSLFAAVRLGSDRFFEVLLDQFVSLPIRAIITHYNYFIANFYNININIHWRNRVADLKWTATVRNTVKTV